MRWKVKEVKLATIQTVCPRIEIPTLTQPPTLFVGPLRYWRPWYIISINSEIQRSYFKTALYRLGLNTTIIVGSGIQAQSSIRFPRVLCPVAILQ